MGSFLQKQIQSQRQQGCILILLTVTGHEQKKQHHQQITGVKILREKML